MSNNCAALGEMRTDLVELGAIEFQPEPLDGLAMQVAFSVMLLISVISAAALYSINWFYPAFMVVVGAHYLPFVFLYGMRAYAVLAAILIGGGLIVGWTLPDNFPGGGWVAAIALLVFSLSVWQFD